MFYFRRRQKRRQINSFNGQHEWRRYFTCRAGYQKTVEQGVDLLVTHMFKEIVIVPQRFPQERVQRIGVFFGTSAGMVYRHRLKDVMEESEVLVVLRRTFPKRCPCFAKEEHGKMATLAREALGCRGSACDCADLLFCSEGHLICSNGFLHLFASLWVWTVDSSDGNTRRNTTSETVLACARFFEKVTDSSTHAEQQKMLT